MEEFFSSLIIITTMFGYGLIKLPIAAASIGTFPTIFMLSFFALITGFSIILLFKACAISNSKSYNELMSKSRFIFTLGQITLFLCAYFSVIGYSNKIVDYLCKLFGDRKKTYIVGFSIIQILFSLLNTLDRLQYVSYFSIASCLFIISLTIYYGISNKNSVNLNISDPIYSNAIGTFCFALCCQNIVPSIYCDLKNKSRAYLIPIFTVIFASILFGLMAVTGFYAGGYVLRSYDDILEYYIDQTGTNSYSLLAILNKIAIFSFIILLNCSCLFQMFPVRNSFTSFFNKKRFYSLIFSLVWIFSVVFILLLEFDLNGIIDITGAYFTSTLAYILPPLIYFNQAKKYQFTYLLLSGIVLTVGIGAIVFFTYESFIKKS